MYDMAIELIAQGHQVKVVCLHDHHSSFEEYATRSRFLEITSAEVLGTNVSFSFRSENTKQTYTRLANIYEEFKPDIIHSHLFQAEIISRSVIYPQAKWFTHCHDNMRQYETFSLSTLQNRKEMVEYYERVYLINRYRKNGGNHFIAISKDTRDYFQRVLPRDLRNITLLLNAINIKRFTRPEGLPAKKPGQIVLTNSGSLVDKKNQIFLLHVVNWLKQQGHNVLLYLLGDGPNRNLLAATINELGLGEQVILKGNVSDVEEYLWQSDFYVHSALYEPFGLVLLEGMAAGLPVISLDGKGNRDIIQNGVNGFLFSDKRPATFGAKIVELMEDRGLYDRIRLAGMKFASKHDITPYVKQLTALYQSAKTDAINPA